jgi:tetratricopeptide (TPR) repeat protein
MSDLPEPEESAVAEAAETTHPAAVAIALGRVTPGASPGLDAAAAGFLADQRRLVNLQAEHLHEQRELQLTHLRVRRWKDRFSLSLQLLAFVVGAAAGVALLGMAWTAHEDHGLVINAFSVPPDLAAEGLTGGVIAQRFLDRLNALQAATESDRPATTFQNNWGEDIKLEIPETGLKLGELEKFLRDRLGNVSYVTGEVYKTGAGLALTARLGDTPPQTFEGPRTDIDSLEQHAAEAVYRFSQPYRFATYLEQHGRVDEAIKIIADLAANGPPGERSWAYALWSTFEVNDLGDTAAGIPLARQSVSFSTGVGSSVRADIALIGAEVWAGHDEQALVASKDLDPKAHERTSETSSAYFEQNSLISSAWLASIAGDLRRSAAGWLKVARTQEYAGLARLGYAMASTELALNHDPKAAATVLQELTDADDTSFLQADAINAFMGLPSYWQAMEREDWQAALADAQRADSWLETHKAKLRVAGLMQSVWMHPLEALALAKAGDLPGAQRLIDTTPADCYLCLRMRGGIAVAGGDWPAAERWFTEATRLGPSLPFAFTDWGRARLAHGDVEGAMAVLRRAHVAGPRFADPLELTGEAQMSRSDWDRADDGFRAAAELAPAWGRIHLKWGESLLRSGHERQARAQLALARNLYLTASEHAEVDGLPK